MFLRSTLAFCLAVALVQGTIDWEAAKKVVEKCKEETGSEQTFESFLIKEEPPKTEKDACMIACYFKAKGIYDDEGKFHRDGTEKYFHEIFEGKPEFIEKAIVIAEECSKIDVEGMDLCQQSVAHGTCAKTKAVQQNITVDKSGYHSSETD